MTTDEAPVAVTETPTKKTAAIPVADQNLADCVKKVSATWILTPAITAVWTTSADLRATTNIYNTNLGARLSKKGEKAVGTRDLQLMDKEVNTNQDYLKTYLKDEYGKDAYTSYFSQFGIVMEHGKWTLPIDRNKRNAAIKLTVEALTKNGFEDKKYGLAYWQDISTRYEAALTLSVDTDGNVAGLVSAKNEARKQIEKTLNALIHIIKGNYPDTYAAVLREWGFQKEKY